MLQHGHVFLKREQSVNDNAQPAAYTRTWELAHPIRTSTKRCIRIVVGGLRAMPNNCRGWQGDLQTFGGVQTHVHFLYAFLPDKIMKGYNYDCVIMTSLQVL